MNFKNAERIEALRVKVLEGEGVPGSPVRVVTYYLSEAGELLAWDDPLEKIKKSSEMDGQ